MSNVYRLVSQQPSPPADYSAFDPAVLAALIAATPAIVTAYVDSSIQGDLIVMTFVAPPAPEELAALDVVVANYPNAAPRRVA